MLSRNMLSPSRSLLDRLRASRPLRTLLLLFALASATAGFHAASHLVEAADRSAITAPLSQDDSNDGAASHQVECPGCRLLGTLSFALTPAAGWELHHASDDDGAPPLLRDPVRAVDPIARWQQRLKHGPPNLLR